MRTFTIFGSIFLALVLIFLPSAALGQRGGMVDGETVSRPAGSHVGAVASPVGSGGGGGVVSGGAGSVPATSSPATSANYAPGAGNSVGMPNLRGTSFGTVDSYYSWNNYYSFLCKSYSLNPLYFSRFYRNSEPLITPIMLKLTLRVPLRLSSEMLTSIGQLEKMIEDFHSGTTPDKQALLEKSYKIREIAKQIRNNQTLSNIDLRRKEDLYKQEAGHESLSPETLTKLREMAVDLDRQLRNAYNLSSTATVSVDNYKEHSFESLAKGIERLCKAIENSSKRM
jgi:hypothetical protein